MLCIIKSKQSKKLPHLLHIFSVPTILLNKTFQKGYTTVHLLKEKNYLVK